MGNTEYTQFKNIDKLDDYDYEKMYIYKLKNCRTHHFYFSGEVGSY